MLQTKVRIAQFHKKNSKWLWVAAAAAALLLIVTFLFLLVAQRSAPIDNNTRLGLGRLSADYELAYKPNSLYDQPKPAAKEARLLAYIDHVKFKLFYQLQGFEGLPAEYEYSVDAQLIARSSESSKYIDPDYTVWQKNYTLVNPTKVTSDGTTNNLEQLVDVNINQYADFAKSIYEKTQVRTTNELKLLFRVKAMVHGPMGDTVDNSTVELIVPMIDNLLIITGTPTAENKLKMIVASPKPAANYTPWLLVCGALALLMLALTAVLLLGGKQPNIQSRFAKTTAKVFKQYGERLVRLENPLPYQQLATISIDGIEEMVKIADEISQPVFYFKADSVEEKKIEFYVFDTSRIYYMVIFGDMGKPRAK